MYGLINYPEVYVNHKGPKSCVQNLVGSSTVVDIFGSHHVLCQLTQERDLGVPDFTLLLFPDTYTLYPNGNKSSVVFLARNHLTLFQRSGVINYGLLFEHHRDTEHQAVILGGASFP
ncbi:hypothetical protein T265_07417 [Opisthorchis viverrini]|uniref:Uncharacterized protein n=1 Tax=Opisthorchis viverrini TaxID=6198 RepID=A0A074ZCK5_OPIVI|nr:hypothetical protein T265_07417 [Opisthorchis viverrini]KER25021.1 hypothetical protein T265_07417 [Opisthorchis viverrini]